MAPLDWAVLALLALCVVNAARRGFLIEAFSLAGLLLGLPLAAWNYRRLLPYAAHWLRSGAFAEALSFLAIAVGVMLFAGLLGRLFRWSARSVGLGWADRLLGAAFGLAKGAVLATIALVTLAAFEPVTPWEGTSIRGSALAPDLLGAAKGTALVAPGTLAGRVRHGLHQLHEEQDGWLRPTDSGAR